jgi:hypothetical protein
MINTNELRQGNIVSRRYYNPEPNNEHYEFQLCVVNSISDKFLNVSDLGSKQKIKIPIEKIFPVILSENIILKLGFVKTTYKLSNPSFMNDIFDYCPFLKEIELCFCSEDNDFHFHFYPHTKYLHSFQNLFFSLNDREAVFSTEP